MEDICHVLLVTNSLVPGGAEAMLVQLAHRLDRRKVRPVVACLREAGPGAEDLAEAAIPVHEQLLKHKFDGRVLGRLRQLVKRYAPACLLAVGSGGDRMFWSALAGRWTHTPVAVWAHILPAADYHAFEWLNRRLYRWVDVFIALGRRHAEALVEHERIPAEHVRIIRNGIDAARFDRPAQRPAARRLMNIPGEQSVVIGIIANLRPDKRHDIFIEAAARAHAARPHTRFVMVGDGPCRAEVERLAARHDPGGEFITRLGRRDDVDLLLPGLDVVCLTSGWHEVLSVAMLEAMAAGRAFVAPRIGSLDEALIDGVTGRFFDPPTAAALAEVLIELIDQPERRAYLGENARRKVQSEFTAGTMARQFEALIVELCGRR